MVRRPVVSSIRSRQTGHVGSSTIEAGGGAGFTEICDGTGDAADAAAAVELSGAKGAGGTGE
jgi:hypothetical protein